MLTEILSRNLRICSFLNKGSLCDLNSENVIIRIAAFCRRVNNDISQDDLDVDVMAVDGEHVNSSSAHGNSHTDIEQNSSTTKFENSFVQITTTAVSPSSTIVLQPSTSSFTPSISTSNLQRLKSLMKNRETAGFDQRGTWFESRSLHYKKSVSYYISSVVGPTESTCS